MFFIFPLITYVVILGLLTAPVAWKWRQRAAWQPWELLSGLAPLPLWMGLILASCKGKSLANYAGEPMYLAVAVAVIAWCRVALASRVGSMLAAICAGPLALTAAWLVWWFVPLLPE